MLILEKWVPIPAKAMLKVVEFKGGEDGAYDIIQWVLDNGSLGLYSPSRKETDLEVYGEAIHIDSAPEEIIIEKDGKFCKAIPGMYVAQKPNGDFFTTTKDDLNNFFKPGYGEV